MIKYPHFPRADIFSLSNLGWNRKLDPAKTGAINHKRNKQQFDVLLPRSEISFCTEPSKNQPLLKISWNRNRRMNERDCRVKNTPRKGIKMVNQVKKLPL